MTRIEILIQLRDRIHDLQMCEPWPDIARQICLQVTGSPHLEVVNHTRTPVGTQVREQVRTHLVNRLIFT